MNLIYNNSICILKLLKTITLLHKSHQVGEKPTPSAFFPRIIRGKKVEGVGFSPTS